MAASRASRRARAWTVVRWSAVVVVLAGLAVAAAANIDELRDVELDVAPWWLLAAAPFTAAASVVLPLAWQRTVIGLGGRLPALTAVRIWWVSQAARFVVTMVGTAAGRMTLAAREGVRMEVAAGAQVVELILLVGWSVGLGSLPGSGAPVAPSVRAVLLVAAVVGLALLPCSAGAGLRLVHRFRPQVDISSVDRRGLLVAEATYGLNAVLRSVAFLFVAAGLLPVEADDVPLLLAGWNLAAVAGIIGVTPAGLGVREGAMVALLAGRFGAGGAAALAALWRAWELGFELVSVATFTLLGRRRVRQSSTT
ncbi:MAG: hypothetical protein ACRD1K_01785 [Acidimicrobiales bacterium]